MTIHVLSQRVLLNEGVYNNRSSYMHLVRVEFKNLVSKRWSGGFSAHNFKMVAFRASPFVASHSLIAALIDEAACKGFQSIIYCYKFVA